MPLPRVARVLLWLLGAVLLLALSFSAATWWYLHPAVNRINGVVYGQRHGQPLAIDVLRPESPNGRGVLVMASGSWKSSGPGRFDLWIAAPLLRRGYTVFAVYHLSQPKASVPEIVADVNRAVRFIRHHAREYGIDPARLGVTGGSSGGHLSLMLATRGGPGPADAADPVDRESSAVQAVACFFPPTDFLNYGTAGEDAVGVGILKNYKPAFGPEADTPEGRQKLGKEISPIYFITAKMPPTLIIHGDADKLVPIQQAESFVKRATEAGAKAKLIVKPGAAHGWKDREPDLAAMADWFDEHLRGTKK
ncbi:MAG: alpha/beta hydrolase [Verrucomicrobia bacterium]|nr:alpha/beta hydrolase [Verrucomicrobiota bacterium]